MDAPMGSLELDRASTILIVGGLFQLLWGLLSGIPMGWLRSRGREVPKYLTYTHMGGLMQGPLLLGLVFAVQLSALQPGWEIFAAASVTAASFLLVLKDLSNWLLGVADEFAERPIGFYVGSALVPLYLVGCLVLITGVVRTLFR